MTKKKTDEAEAPELIDTAAAETAKAPTLELLYLGNKSPKVIEMPDGHTVTFTKTHHREPGKAVLSCEVCYAYLMERLGPGAATLEEVIVVPPGQLAQLKAAKAEAIAQREASLKNLAQPWKDQQAVKQGQS